MKVSYGSDFHLEFGFMPDFSKTEGGDVLILAGDILVAAPFRPDRTDKDATRMRKHLKDLKKDLLDKFDVVLYVMGNHEHYNSIYKYTIKTIKHGLDEAGIKNVHILEDEEFIHKGTPFIGATLWSDFYRQNPVSMLAAENGMNDFHIIGTMDVDDMNYFNRYKSRTLTAQDVLGIHTYSLNYIKNRTQFHSNVETVVITHHAPSYSSLNKDHSGNSLDGAYASDLSEFILNSPNITHWIHGHCHMNTNYLIGTCNVISCQRGYRHEESFREFVGPKSFYIGE